MTTLKQIQLTCPVCDEQFTSQAVQTTNSFGGKRTDFHERAAGSQPLPYYVHLCPRCGFAGGEQAFSERFDVGPTIKQRVWDELAPRVSERELTGSEKYEAAAKVAEWHGDAPRMIADLLLRAAWCCVDEGDIEAERYFRRKAAAAFADALAQYDSVNPDERAVLTYLVGELYRRSGDVRSAYEWFKKVEEEINEPEKQQWVLEAARRQATYPREYFG